MAKTKPTPANPATKAPAAGHPREGTVEGQGAAKFVAVKAAGAAAGKNPGAAGDVHKDAEARGSGPEPVKVAMLASDAGAYAEMTGGAAPEAAPAEDETVQDGSAAAETAGEGAGLSTGLIIGGVLLGGAGIAAAASGGGGKHDGGSEERPNVAPALSAATQTVTTKEDAAATISVSATDANGDALAYTAGEAAHGTVTGGDNGAFVYTPNADFNGADSFEVTVSDGKGGTATQTVNVTVTAENDAPTFSSATRSLTTSEDEAVSFAPGASDVDGDALTYAVSAATGGSAAVGADGRVTFTPTADFSGDASFVLTASDGNGGTVTQTVNVTVTAENDAPTFSSATRSLTTSEDEAMSFAPGASDVDGDTLTYAVSAATGGSATVGADGRVTFTPTADFSGDASFVLTASDGNGGTANQTVNVTVAPVNDAPVFASAELAVEASEDESVTIEASAQDIDGDALTYSVSGATNGMVAVGTTPGSFVFTPDDDFNGVASFQLTATDPSGATATQTVTINVAAVNDAPTIEPTASRSLTTSEDAQVAFVIDASDVDTPEGELVATIATAPEHGRIVTDEQGQSFYRPDANFSGTDSFIVSVSDGQASTSYTVNVTVTPVNDAPVFGSATRSLTTDEDQPISFQPGASDVDGDALTYAVDNIANGTANIGSDGSITFTPAANFHGQASFILTASDGQGGVASQTVSITVVNQPDIVDLDALDQLENGGDGDPTTPLLVDASNTDYRFDDSADKPSSTWITGFGSDDYIQVDEPIENYNFSSNGQDISISYQTADGAINLFELDGVVTDSSVLVFDKASAAKAVGFDFFTTSAPPQPATTISLDVDTDNNLNTVALFSGAGFATTFTQDANMPDFVQIRNFGADDRITLLNADPDDFNFSSNGDDIFISYQTPGGASNDITIVGAVRDSGVLVFDEASAEEAVGFDFFQAASDGGTTPPPPAQTSNLDIDTDNNLNSQAVFDAAGIAATFTEDADVPDYVQITGFGSDDRILVTNAASGDFNFSSNGTDIFISYQSAGGAVNDISIVGVVQDSNVLVFDEASAEKAVGFDFFQFG
ncbi:tandem-95 repeat protein [Sphingobium sp. CFD-2]|uniref:tandem-95 repeat protein n=1 Tax=Sphingobium sp. CFD-2 TaxID=2878542 RepID=UPI00214CFC94|nr:tandem-95 repeat protein [Sphingobium sp. CFD-2]